MKSSYNTKTPVATMQKVSSSYAIPEGLITKARLNLQRHGEGPEAWFHTTTKGMVYLHGVFTLMQDVYQGRTVEQLMALAMVTTNVQPTPEQAVAMEMWTIVGEHVIGHVLESAGRYDLVERYRQFLAKQGDFNYKDLDGLVCVIKLGHGYYAPFRDDYQPQISHILRPTDPHYRRVMKQNRDYNQRAKPYIPRPHYPQSQWSFIA